MKHALLATLILLIGANVFPSLLHAAGEKFPPDVYQRTVFLGDSITDGNTYPQLVRDALADAKLPKMIAINAGIGGDTAVGMRARLDRDVFPFSPTLVTLSAGANDAMHGVSVDAYERDVRGIVEQLKAKHIPLILLTPNVLGPKQQIKGQKNLDAYEAVLRKIAAEEGLRLAEVNQRQKQDAAAGHPQLAPDDLHPNWTGQTMIARAVLDAMGYPDAAVPDHITNKPLPGIISEWRVQAINPKAPGAATTNPADNWIKLKLPETAPIPDFDANNRWLDDYRTMGAAVSLRQQPPGSFMGFAELDSDAERPVRINTGAELEVVWLNGKEIYRNDWKHGYHIGRESVSATLQKGTNHIMIKTGAVFFLSVTGEGKMYWEERTLWCVKIVKRKGAGRVLKTGIAKSASGEPQS